MRVCIDKFFFQISVKHAVAQVTTHIELQILQRLAKMSLEILELNSR